MVTPSSYALGQLLAEVLKTDQARYPSGSLTKPHACDTTRPPYSVASGSLSVEAAR